jgi:hypothetical protein
MNLAPVFKQQFFDNNGAVLAGGKLYSYLAGTTTAQATYANAAGTVNANPVVLDSAGRADVWLDPTIAYKLVLQDVNGVQIWSEDNIQIPIVGLAWNANQTYSQGSIVQDASGQGLLYVSRINNNVNQALTNVSAWRVLGGNVQTYSSNTNLAVTDDLVRSNSTSGALTHTVPPCSSTPIGKRITVKDVGTGGYTTSVKGSGTDTIDGNNIYATALIQYQSATFENNGTSWDVLGIMGDGAVTSAKLATGAVTQAKLAPRATGTTVVAGGVAVSASSGAFSTSSTSYVDVTNLAVTLTTTGRPVMVGVVSDGSGSNSVMESSDATQNPLLKWKILRGATTISSGSLSSPGTGLLSCAPVGFILDAPAAGTYTYKLQISSNSSATTSVAFCSLVAYEL